MQIGLTKFAVLLLYRMKIIKFLEKNWAQLLLVATCIIGVVFSSVLLSRADRFQGLLTMNFGARALWIGYLVFFLGVGLMLCLRMTKVNRGWAHGMLLATGIVVLIFMFVALGDTMSNWQRIFGGHHHTDNEANSWMRGVAVIPVVIQLFVFGLFPVIIGARRLLNHYHVNHARKKKEVK